MLHIVEAATPLSIPIAKYFFPPYTRRMEQTTSAGLYRFFDKDGTLLYVGLSFNVRVRIQQHHRTAPWFRSVATISIERFADAVTLRAAEKTAVATEAPKYNQLLRPTVKKLAAPSSWRASREYLGMLDSAKQRRAEVAELRYQGLPWWQVGALRGITGERARQMHVRWREALWRTGEGLDVSL